MSRSRSSSKVKGQISITFEPKEKDFIFGMHDYLTKPHILGYDMSRLRSRVITFDHIEIDS